MSHVLLYEPDLRKVPHLKFLLQLAHVECTAVHSFEELYNRLDLGRNEIGGYDLVVLNSLDGLDPQAQLEAVVGITEIPILCMAKEKQSLAQEIYKKVEFCRSYIFLTAIQERLERAADAIETG